MLLHFIYIINLHIHRDVIHRIKYIPKFILHVTYMHIYIYTYIYT